MEYYVGFMIVAFVLHCFLALVNGIRDGPNELSTFNVLDYGAIGDGKHDEVQAFTKAWDDLCRSTGGDATLRVPSGKTYLLSPISFRGPCKFTTIHLEIQGTIVAPDTFEAWRNCEDNGWLVFSYIDNLIVDGSGEINGKGSIWWKKKVTISDVNGDKMCSYPQALQFSHCNGLKLGGLRVRDSPRRHIAITACNETIVSNLHITAPKDSPNTDGIDISYSTKVQILDSSIGTGDDCIAIGSDTSWVNISGINCGPGHGISVGSLGKDGDYAKVEQVHVRNCTFKRTSNGARIKTWQGGLGYARSITFEDIPLIDVENPIIIDQYYCDGKHGCAIQKSAVEISDVRYSGFGGTSASSRAVTLNCSDTIPCTNIVMNAINITSLSPTKRAYAVCRNAQGQATSVAPQIACLK